MSDNDLGSQGDGDALDNGEGEEIEALKGGGEESEGADDKPDKGKGVEGNESESEEEGFVKGRAIIQWLEPDPELAPGESPYPLTFLQPRSSLPCSSPYADLSTLRGED